MSSFQFWPKFYYHRVLELLDLNWQWSHHEARDWFPLSISTESKLVSVQTVRFEGLFGIWRFVFYLSISTFFSAEQIDSLIDLWCRRISKRSPRSDQNEALVENCTWFLVRLVNKTLAAGHVLIQSENNDSSDYANMLRKIKVLVINLCNKWKI